MEFPPVSVVMPVRNEERHLADAVRHVLGQDYPGPLELVLAVGPSADRTERIARDLAGGSEGGRGGGRGIKVLANPNGTIPAALNAAVGAARHDVIARVDGHALLPPGYVRAAVTTLTATGAADVGGIMAAEGVTPFQRAVAWAMTSKAGVGSAAFHTGGEPGPAASVYLGVYRREAIEQAGGYDEAMLRAEDWELNYRIRARGGLIWFTPELRVTYRPRASVRALAAQYFHYGRWRRVIVRDHPETASFRYLAPPAAAALVACGLAVGLAGLAAIAAAAPAALRWLVIGLVIPVGYLAGITAVAAALARGVPARVRARIPVVLGVMHMCWGAGFLTSPGRLARSLHAKARSAQHDQPPGETAAAVGGE
jgi:succinoglycan biosynthesis protein ExoA